MSGDRRPGATALSCDLVQRFYEMWFKRDSGALRFLIFWYLEAHFLIPFLLDLHAGALHLFDKKNRVRLLGVIPDALAIFSSCRFTLRSIPKLATTLVSFDFVCNFSVVISGEFNI